MTSDVLPYLRNDDGCLLPLPGVESLFLTSSTVEICGLNIEDTDGKNELQEVSKERLLSDIQFRGAISDFHPIKARIQAADCDPLLIKSNPEDRYNDGNNYELAVTREAVECWREVDRRKQAEREQRDAEILQKKAEKTIPKFKRQRVIKPWISQGSEKEIENLDMYTSTPVLIFQKQGKDFARKLNLSEVSAEEFWCPNEMECWPYENDPVSMISTKLKHSGTQGIPQPQDKAIQVSSERCVLQSTQYSPQLLTEQETETILQSKDMQCFLGEVYPLVKEELITSQVVDVLEDDFGSQMEDQGTTVEKKESLITEYQSLIDLHFSKSRIVSHMEWSPHKKGILAVSSVAPLSVELRSEEAGNPGNYAIVEWSISNPMNPESFLLTDYEIATFNYHPFSAYLLAGGTYTGQIVMWDREKTTSGVHSHCSASEFSHNAPITDLKWIPKLDISKSGSLLLLESDEECFVFVTCSSDGKLLFWDLRLDKHLKKGRQLESDAHWNMKPLISIPLFGVEGGEFPAEKICLPYLLSKLELRISSSNGDLAVGNLSKTQEDEHPEIIEDLCQAHGGAIVCIERSPFFSDILLTAGGWTFKLWREGYKNCLFVSPNASSSYTTAVWSPTRPGVLVLATEAGIVEVWDLLDKTHEASLTCKICPISLTTLGFSNDVETTLTTKHVQQSLAIGDSQGIIHLMNVPRSLRRPLYEEKKLMAKLIHHQLTTLDVSSKVTAPKESSDGEQGENTKEKDKSEEEIPDEEEDFRKLEMEMREQLGLAELVN